MGNRGGGLIGIIKRAAVVLALTALTGCSAPQPEKYTREIYAMNTFMSLTAYGDNPQIVQEALDSAVERINGLEKALSVTIPESDVSRLNSSGGEPVSVGSDALNIIAKSLEISERSGGALDITIYPVLRAWGFTTGEYSVPSDDELASLLEYVDYTQIRISGNEVTLPEGFSVDTGALAKGYAGGCSTEILRNAGVSSAILNLGGNVCAIGSKPDGSPWKIAVASPFEGEDYAGYLTAADKFVITSGKYERYFTDENGAKYHHIIDPKTGAPADNGISSVTVVGSDGLECDALSTALLVLGKDGAEEYWRKYGGFDMILITDDHRIAVTEGVSEQFSASPGYTIEVIKNYTAQE